MIAYRIRRKGTVDQFFIGAKGQKTFWEPAHAKAAFNYASKRNHAAWINVTGNRFDDQDLWELVTYDLVERKEG
jgi:hypothetical protein